MKNNNGSKKRTGIKANIVIAFSVFCAVILLILWLCQVVFLDTIYKQIKITEIKLSAEDVLKNLENENYSDYCQNLAEKNDLCILVLQMIDDYHGVKRVSVHTQDNCAIHDTDNSSKFVLFESTKENNGEYLQYFQYDQQNRIYKTVDLNDNDTYSTESIVYSKISTVNGNTFFAVISSSIAPVEATTRTLFYLLVAITVIVVLMAVVLSIIISNTLSKPIIRLNDGAKALAKRDYSVSFSEDGYKEVAELGKSLNYATSELSKVDDLCKELIANVSHDLRTPLTMIRGYSEVMRDIPGENSPENVQIIIDEADRLTALVNDILDISRFQNGQTKFEKSVFCLTSEVSSAVERYNKLLLKDGYNIDFVNECNEDVYVNSDKTRILQVLYNLINNGVTYTGENKEVIVKQTINGSNVRISVIDTGEGIEPQYLADIWDRYYKVDKTHKRAIMGTGLGLSIVKKIIALAGGKCGVSSVPNVGSTFYFELERFIEKTGW